MIGTITGEGILAVVGFGVWILILVVYAKLMRRADRRRVIADVEKHRGRVLSCKWRLGWNFAMFFDSERYFEVIYETESGEVFSIVAKTGMFTGVSYRDDTKTVHDSQSIR